MPVMSITSSKRGRSTARRVLGASFTTAILSAALLAGTESNAAAAGLNDPNCRPTSDKPYPVIVVHGQAGNFEGMSGVTNTLVRNGYCVFAKNYGSVNGSPNGQDHVWTSAEQIEQLLDEVLRVTGADKVDVVGHSAGVGVLDNLIMAKGRADSIHNAVMFGGLHHPYAHLGIPKYADATFYLPNLISAARLVVPGITAQQVVKIALSFIGGTGGIDPGLASTITSNFANDLFDPDYWPKLHGAHSEAAGHLVKLGQSQRSRATNDADPNVCYTNIVATGDFLAGPAAGFQDEASNVDNFLLNLVTMNSHNDMLGDATALKKMLTGLTKSCTPGTKRVAGTLIKDNATTDEDEAAANAFRDAFGRGAKGRDGDDDDDGETGGMVLSSGCAVTTQRPSSRCSTGIGVGCAVALLALRRRKRHDAPTA